MCGSFLRGEEGLPCSEVIMSKVALPELERVFTVEYDMCFSVEVTSTAAGGAVAGTVEVVVCIGSESDRVIHTEIVICDEAGNGAGDGTVPTGRGH